MESCAKRIRSALQMRNMKQIELSELTGIPKSAISQYCSGAFKPKQKRLFLIAKALDVDEAWLMGLDVPMNRNIDVPEANTSSMPETCDLKKITKSEVSIGKNIKALRERAGLSQLEFAKILGVTDKAVSTWENETRIPRMGVIQKMADFFEIKKTDIIEGFSSLDFPCNAITMSEMQKTPLAGIVTRGTPILATENINEAAATEGLLAEIERLHGKGTADAFSMYTQLDADDQGEIRGEMKQMLKAEKYAKKQYVYRAARSTDHAEAEMIERDADLIRKLEAANNVTSDEDL